MSLLYSFKGYSLELDTQSLIKGGTAITSQHSLYNSLINSPSLLAKRNFSIELQLTSRVSQDLYSLIQDWDKIENTDLDRIKKMFNEKNNAYLQGNVGFSLYNFGFSHFKRGSAYAILDNPVYPKAQTSLSIEDGYVVGYGSQFKKIIYGVSVEKFKKETRIFSANVLEYEKKVSSLLEEKELTIGNLGLGYLFENDLSLVFNFKNSDKFRSYSGIKKKIHDLNFALEFHDMQDNNLENSIHYGLDYSFSIFKLNLGMNQNYLSYGISLDGKYVNLSLGYVKMNAFEQHRDSFNNFTFNLSFGYNL